MNNNYVRKIHLKTDLNKIKHDYKYMTDSKIDDVVFLNARLITSILIFILIVIMFKYGYIYAPIVTVIYYKLFYYYFITNNIKKRTVLLEKEAIPFFEMFSLCLSSGYNIEKSLEIVVNHTNYEITLLFKKVLYEITFGKSLNESLDNIKSSIDSEYINNIILNIKESNIYGSDLVNQLDDQIKFLKIKRNLKRKEELNKMPIKISVISVIILVPLMLLLIIGPLLINYL